MNLKFYLNDGVKSLKKFAIINAGFFDAIQLFFVFF